MAFSPVLIEVYYNGTLSLSYIPQDAMTMAEVADSARKAFAEKYLIDPELLSLVSLPINKRRSLDEVDENIKKAWPVGLKTINVQSFEIKMKV